MLHPKRYKTISSLAVLAFAFYTFGCSTDAGASSRESIAQEVKAKQDELALTQQFNQEFDRQLARDAIFFQTKQITKTWNLLDDIVVSLLNSGHSAAEIDRFFTTLRGFEGPNSGTVIGTSVFYSGSRRETPTYVLTPPTTKNPQYLFGTFNYGVNGRGRLSVYTKRANRWARTSRFDGDYPISLYQLPTSDSSLPLITVERFTGGDHEDGYLKAWRLTEGKLGLQKIETDRLMDLDIERADDVVYGFYSESPGLNEAFLGTRIKYKLIIHSSGGRIEVDNLLLNPWLKVVSEFYEYLEAKNLSKARQLLENDFFLETLTAFDSPSMFGTDGDLNNGTGFVVLQDREEYLRVDVRRNLSGQWKITNVSKIEKP